jgi:hypothetical protein
MKSMLADPASRKRMSPKQNLKKSLQRAPMRLGGISLLILVLALPASLNAETTDSLGMWVWSHSAFSTPEARQKLVDFCVKHHINHLDDYARISFDGHKPILRDAQAFKDLILLAGEHNITTAALRGDPKMFFARNHEKTLQELRAIITFSETLPRDNLFKGITYDVEPYLTKEWKAKGRAREAVMLDYLTFLRKAGSVLDEEAPDFRLAVDAPFWWDNDELTLEFEGRRKRFSEHVQDLTDFIVIMSYRRSPKEVLSCVQGEQRYGERIHKTVFPSLETVQLKKNPQTSFWGVPRGKFWKVVPQLMETAKKDPALGGVMIHCYRSLVDRSKNETSKPPEARNTR